MSQSFFYVELTDTFAGEANFSWVQRFKVSAQTMRGAVWKISRETGGAWRAAWDSGEMMRYDSKSHATCFFIEHYDDERHSAHTLREI